MRAAVAVAFAFWISGLCAGCNRADGTSLNPLNPAPTQAGGGTGPGGSGGAGGSGAAAAFSSISGTGPILADGLSPSIVTIVLKTANNVAVVGTTPSFSATDTGSTNVYVPCTPTDNTGTASCAFTSSYSEVKTLTINSPVSVTGGTVDFNGPATHIAFSTQPGNGISSTSLATQPVVQVLDSKNRIVTSVAADAGATITMTLGSGTGALAGTLTKVAASGVANFSANGLKVDLAGVKQLQATKTGGLPAANINSSNFTISAGTAVDATSTITVSAATVKANNSDQATFTISLKDAAGNPCIGVNTSLAATGTGNTITQPVAVTDTNGQATGTLQSTFAEQKTANIATPFVGTAKVNKSFSAGGINFEVPIELVDYGISNVAGTSNFTSFYRTQTTFNTTDYDGTVSTSFEVVGTNSDGTSYTVRLLDSGGNPKATVNFPNNIATPQRVRVPFTPNAGLDTYRVELQGGSGANTLTVTSARIIVKQIGGTKTKVYVPLVNTDSGTVSNSTSQSTQSTASTTYPANASEYFRIWNWNSGAFTNFPVSTINMTLEAVMSGSTAGSTVSVGLGTLGSTSAVAGTVATVTGTALVLSQASFTSASLTTATDYELKFKVSAGTGNLFRAGLWIQVNDITQGEVYYRLMKRVQMVTTATRYDADRIYFDSSLFSHAVPTYESTGHMAAVASTGTTQLIDVAVSDIGTSGSSVAATSQTYNSPTKSRQRSATLALTNGDRFLNEIAQTSGAAFLQMGSAHLVCGFSQ